MENTTTPNGEETETEIVSTAVSVPELAEDQPEELREVDDEEDGAEAVGSGFVSGAFGLTSLLVALVSLTGGWLGPVLGTREQYIKELNAKSQSAQVTLDGFHSSAHTQAAFSGIFAIAALVIAAGVFAAPSLLLSGRTPVWARATALGGVIVGAIGLLLAILTWYNVLAPGLTAPASVGG
jgi:hypothetical protein